jgi:C4-dicarboxylate-specific signal transduction histidine kinase
LYYVIFIASFTLAQFVYDGFAVQYFRPHALWSNPHLALFLLICVHVMALKFVTVYLGTRTRSPLWHRIVFGQSLLWGIILLLFPVVSFSTLTRATMFLGVVNTIITVACSISVWRKGYKPMRFFLLSWVVFMVSTDMFLLVRLGIMPSSVFTEHSYQIGILLMAILLAVAFAERVRLVQQEKAVAQAHVMTTLLVQERLVREQNTLLERNVAERTAELQEYRDHLEERVQEELSIRQQQERLLIQKSKLESLGVLAAGIAHEINQPLTRITFGADSLLLKLTRHEAPEIDDLETKCGIILESVERISRIIDHIRTFSRDQHSMRDERIDVHATIQNALSLVRTQYQHHNILIHTELQATGWVMGNQYKLEQVILNLLSNARDAIEVHTDAISAAFQENAITIRTFDRQRQMIIEVADTGAGIAEDTLPHIFDPFFTTKAVGRGTGLGLSISYGIIKDMRGDMSVASDGDTGTVMTITLPRISTRATYHEPR